MPADGMSAAVEKGDFGTSTRQLCYQATLVSRKYGGEEWQLPALLGHAGASQLLPLSNALQTDVLVASLSVRDPKATSASRRACWSIAKCPTYPPTHSLQYPALETDQHSAWMHSR